MANAMRRRRAYVPKVPDASKLAARFWMPAENLHEIIKTFANQEEGCINKLHFFVIPKRAMVYATAALIVARRKLEPANEWMRENIERMRGKPEQGRFHPHTDAIAVMLADPDEDVRDTIQIAVKRDR